MKKLYDTLGDDNKSKSIIVDGDLHNRLKKFCRSKGLKIGSLIENLIKMYLNDPQLTQKNIDELKDKI